MERIGRIAALFTLYFWASEAAQAEVAGRVIFRQTAGVREIKGTGQSLLRATRGVQCIEAIEIAFDEPMRVATVVGSIYLLGGINFRQGLTLKSVDDAFENFVFTTGEAVICQGSSDVDQLVFAAGIWTLAGQRAKAPVAVSLGFRRQTGSEAVAQPREQGAEEHQGSPRHVERGGTYLTVSEDRSGLGNAAIGVVQQLLGNPTSNRRSAAWKETFRLNLAWEHGTKTMAPCRTDTTCFSVTPTRLNQAITRQMAWLRTEANDIRYASERLRILPLELLLTPYAPQNRERQWGTRDVIFALRRAAAFVQFLFPDLSAIPVGDLSGKGGTPPASGATLLHPAGSHTGGRDADVVYITAGSGHLAGAAPHWERNFWYLYGLMQSTGVDLVISAFKGRFTEMAQTAFIGGLINGHAAGRLSMMMEDDGLNHDQHLHVSVTNLRNGGMSRRFQASDDVYACYLALKPQSPDGAANLCVNR